MSKKQHFNIGDLDNFSTGGGITEHNYRFSECQLCLHKGFADNASNAERLGFMATLTPEGEGSDGIKTEKRFWSMGSKAHLSFIVDPDTGTTLLPKAGAPASKLPPSTNFLAFIMSLYNADPTAVEAFDGDVAVFEDMVAHIAPQPESEERKGYKSQVVSTSDVADSKANNQDSRPKTIPCITEVIEARFLEGS